MLQPLDNVHSVLHLPRLMELPPRLECLGCAMPMVENDETFHSCALDDHLKQVARMSSMPTGRRLVEAGDHPAKRNSCPQVDAVEYSLEGFPSDIIEVHIDSVGTPLRQRVSEKLLLSIVDRRIEAELASLDVQQCRVVEMKFFGGLTIAEIADALNVSTATVEREWFSARAWLYERLSGGTV
jgi:RNA polymerase sigma factor (sigma-70 family)